MLAYIVHPTTTFTLITKKVCSGTIGQSLQLLYFTFNLTINDLVSLASLLDYSRKAEVLAVSYCFLNLKDIHWKIYICKLNGILGGVMMIFNNLEMLKNQYWYDFWTLKTSHAYLQSPANFMNSHKNSISTINSLYIDLKKTYHFALNGDLDDTRHRMF